ncbi:phosphotransferase family protein [Camelliibacillus cellulosilyticus]|uniref:Phosphotransferase family protein n=1 Tax=Camelliibacillus cellulosilyticus TaxID=2174486 RepID=A0ABV9GJB1_9BACL
MDENTALKKNITCYIKDLDPNNELVRCWPLKGGKSADVTAFEIKQANEATVKCVIRQYGRADLERNPNVARDEYKLLQILTSEGLPVPKPYAFDPTGERFDRPSIVIEYIDGQPVFTESVSEDTIKIMATRLAMLHRINPSTHDLTFLIKQTDRFHAMFEKYSDQLAGIMVEERVQTVFDLFSQKNQPNPFVLTHGDFWPGNLLWKNGKLAAIIDWEDATLTDPLLDVANSRLEIFYFFGSEATERFTTHYQKLCTDCDFTRLPCWDLCVGLRSAVQLSQFGLDKQTEKTMRERNKQFTNLALKQLI